MSEIHFHLSLFQIKIQLSFLTFSKISTSVEKNEKYVPEHSPQEPSCEIIEKLIEQFPRSTCRWRRTTAERTQPHANSPSVVSQD
jgi:hypothetical protein